MTQEEKEKELAEQELADKIKPLIAEKIALEFNRGNGITLEKNDYVGDRLADIEKELGKLKTEKKKLKNKL